MTKIKFTKTFNLELCQRFICIIVCLQMNIAKKTMSATISGSGTVCSP
jgi:hypothetical protein